MLQNEPFSVINQGYNNLIRVCLAILSRNNKPITPLLADNKTEKVLDYLINIALRYSTHNVR